LLFAGAKTSVTSVSRLLCVFLSCTVYAQEVIENSPQEEVGRSSAIVYVVPIEGMIDEVEAAFIKRAVGMAVEGKAEHVIFEIKTYGGRVDSAEDICEHINSLEEHNISAIMYIPNKAISAGAMISLACEKIYMRSSAKIGDAKPVVGGEPSTEEKYLSMIRAVMRAQAEHNGHNPYIATAMADQSIELVAVEVDGKIEVMDTDAYLEKRNKAKEASSISQ